MLDLNSIKPVKKLQVKKIAEWSEGFLQIREDWKVVIFFKRDLNNQKIRELLHQVETLETEKETATPEYADELRAQIRSLEKAIQFESKEFYKDRYHIEVKSADVHNFMETLQDTFNNGMWSCLYHLGRPVSDPEFQDNRGFFKWDWVYSWA